MVGSFYNLRVFRGWRVFDVFEEWEGWNKRILFDFVLFGFFICRRSNSIGKSFYFYFYFWFEKNEVFVLFYFRRRGIGFLN